MSGKRPPKPVEFERDLEAVVALASTFTLGERTRPIIEEYATAYRLGLVPYVGEKGRSGGVSDPTASTATGDHYIATRARVAEIAQHAAAARRELQAMQAAFRRLYGARKDGVKFPDEEPLSQKVSGAELDAAREAQTRREQRGEHVA